MLIPNLERSVNGATFQVVARGVEDLQVQYMKQAMLPPEPSRTTPPLWIRRAPTSTA